MERTLATLALGPEVTVLLFLHLKLLLSLDVNILNTAFAIAANDVLTGREDILAAQTGSLNLRELEKTNI